VGVVGIRNVHFVICISWARHVAYMRLIKGQSKYLSGNLDKQCVDELSMKLKSSNSPQSSVSTAAVSVLFKKLWYGEIHVGCAFYAPVLRFFLFTSVWEITRI